MEVLIRYKDRDSGSPNCIRGVKEMKRNSQMKAITLITEEEDYFINFDAVEVIEITEDKEE